MSAATNHDVIFRHEGDARVASSVVVAGMLAVLVGGAFMAIGPTLKPERTARTGAAPPGPVRVIGTAPRDNLPCDQQVWPDIAQRCLVRADTTGVASKDANKDTTAAATPPVQETDKLSPLTATAVVHPAPSGDDATTGSGVQEDTAVLRQRAPINVTASPDVDDDDIDEAPPPVQPRDRAHRHYGFHLRIGPFRF